MIQRIQTLYLFLVVALMTVVSFLPLGTFVDASGTLFKLDAMGLNSVGEKAELLQPLWALFALSALSALLAFSAIFMYKKRITQIRITLFNCLIQVGFYAVFGYFFWKINKEIGGDFKGHIALILPFIAIVFNYLAIRAIGADEALVRSLDRLR